jgi:hypothetical protein
MAWVSPSGYSKNKSKEILHIEILVAGQEIEAENCSWKVMGFSVFLNF